MCFCSKNIFWIQFLSRFQVQTFSSSVLHFAVFTSWSQVALSSCCKWYQLWNRNKRSLWLSVPHHRNAEAQDDERISIILRNPKNTPTNSPLCSFVYKQVSEGGVSCTVSHSATEIFLFFRSLDIQARVVLSSLDGKVTGNLRGNGYFYHLDFYSKLCQIQPLCCTETI